MTGACCLLAVASAPAAECTAQSGQHTAALLELYTSEGCNSCPPADAWLSQLPRNGLDSRRVVPLALHVDYWDTLGWPDPFAQNRFTLRQRHHARLQRSATVYTPQFLLNGRDFRSWHRGAGTQVIEQSSERPARAAIRLTLTRAGADTLRLSARAEVMDWAQHHDAELYVALYENRLVSAIPTGENAGRTLTHDYVVRRLLGPFALDLAGTLKANETLRLEPGWKPRDLGAAAFVQRRDTGEVLQALALAPCLK
jgi:hypothetical protein